MDFIYEYWPYVAALLPTVGVAFLFYWIIRYMIEADRRERKALARWNKEHGEQLTGEKKELPRSLGDSDQS